MAVQKCRSSAVTIVANVRCMLTTLESGWLCSECFIYLILLHTHNNPARMGNISPVFQVKKQAQIDWITRSQSHELSLWSWIWREESGSRTHTLSQGQRLRVCPPYHAGARSLPPLLPPPPSPAPGQLGPMPCGVTGERCRQLSFCWDPVVWRREEKCQNLEIFEFLLFGLNACLKSVGFIVECSLWSQDWDNAWKEKQECLTEKHAADWARWEALITIEN